MASTDVSNKRQRTNEDSPEEPQISALLRDRNLLWSVSRFLDDRSCVALACCSSVWCDEMGAELEWRRRAAALDETLRENQELVNICLKLLWSFKAHNRRMARELLLSAFDTTYRSTTRWEERGEAVFTDNKMCVRTAVGFKGVTGIFRSGKALLFPTDVLRTFVVSAEGFLESRGKSTEAGPAPIVNSKMTALVKHNILSYRPS